MITINRIKELRNQKNMSLIKMAEDLKEKGFFETITDSTLSRYENGTREPKLDTWQKLADYFGVSVPYLQGIHEITMDEVNEHFDAGIYHYLTSDDEKDANIKQWLRTAVTLYEDAKLHDNSELDFTFEKLYNDLFNAISAASNASNKLKGYSFKQSIELFTDTVNELEKQSKYPVFWGDASKFQDENGNFSIKKYNEHFHISNDENV